MVQVTIDQITLRGITIRTSNEKEMNPATGKIGPLWQSFYSNFTESTMPSVGYGIYHNYESDHRGLFDLTVAAEVDELSGSDTITIPAATYMKFSVKGECPAAVLSEWMKIWAYFETADAPKRSYKYDFEKYLSMTEAEIYIGIEA